MGAFIDLTGKRFTRLLVLERLDKRKSEWFWKCQCDCGNEKEVRTDCLTNGVVQSCGCIKKEQDKINLTKTNWMPIVAKDK